MKKLISQLNLLQPSRVIIKRNNLKQIEFVGETGPMGKFQREPNRVPLLYFAETRSY